MKGKLIAQIIIYSIILLVLVSLLTGVLAFDAFHFRTSSKTETVYVDTDIPASFDASVYDSLEINWAAGDITIQPDNVQTIQITEFGGKEPMQILVSGHTVTVNFMESKTKISSLKNVKSKDLTILVPKDWECSQLEISAASTAVDVSDLTIRKAIVETASGDICFNSCAAEILKMDSASGDLDFIGCLKETEINGVSADVNLVLDNIPDKIEMNSVSGALDLTLPYDAGFTLKSDTLSKHLNCDFAVENRDGRIVCGDGHCRIELSGLSGQMGIHKGSSPSCAHGTGLPHEGHVNKHH